MASQRPTLNAAMSSEFLLISPHVATVIAIANLGGRTRTPAAGGIGGEK